MKAIFIIAHNTFREIIRDRILYGILVFVFLLIGLSLALGQLSFAEQARISANFGLTAIHISSVILAIFVGSSLVNKEIEKKTILTLLARPISRLDFLIGKSIGLFLIVITVISTFAIVLAAVFLMLGVEMTWTFPAALLGIFLESVILLGVAILFSSFSSSFMVVAFTLGFFLIGHWVESLEFFASKSDSPVYRAIGFLFVQFLPNFENLNWRENVIYYDPISIKTIIGGIGYSISWFLFFLTITTLIFRRREFE